MKLDEAIKTFTNNAEYERTHGNLQGCIEFKQFAKWLKELKQLREQEPVLEKIREEIKSKKFGLTDTEDGIRIQSDIHAGFNGGIECALQIIDKYTAEGREE